MKKLLFIPFLLLSLVASGQILNTASPMTSHYYPAESGWDASSFSNGIVWAETSDSITWDSISAGGTIASRGQSFPLYPFVLSNADSTLGWYIAETASITTDGSDSVTTWADKTTNGNDLTAADGTGAAPYYNPGTDSISFNGLDDGNWMSVAIAAYDQPATLFAVFRENSDQVDAHYFAGSSTSRGQIYRASSNRVIMYCGSVLFSSNNTVDYGNWQVGQFTFDGASSSIKFDDDTPDTGDAGSNDPDALVISGDDPTPASTSMAHMAVKEIIVTLCQDPDNLNAIHAYLQDKYGL